MKRYSAQIILLNLFLVLAYFLWTVRSKEDLLKTGKLVLLELAPVDPRSLMQGDYMLLDYRIAQNQQVDTLDSTGFMPDTRFVDSLPPRGFCVVTLAENGVAQRVRMQKGREPLGSDEYLIPYTKDRSNIRLGSDSYFFQEGKADLYAEAKYGALRVDRKGNTLLTGLYDEGLREIR